VCRDKLRDREACFSPYLSLKFVQCLKQNKGFGKGSLVGWVCVFLANAIPTNLEEVDSSGKGLVFLWHLHLALVLVAFLSGIEFRGHACRQSQSLTQYV
jgi:hypothetical protein